MRGAGGFMSRDCWGWWGWQGSALGGGTGSQASVPHHPCTGSSFISLNHMPAGAQPWGYA